MLTNPVEQQILDVIKEDINKSEVDYSTLTNNQIASQINKSVFSVRDKIDNLSKKKYLIRRINYWTKDNQYHNRIIYLERGSQLDRK